MLTKKIAWIILVIGLMMNNIGLSAIIREDFRTSAAVQNNLYEVNREEHTDVILIDEAIPGGKAVQKDNQNILGYAVYLTGLTLTFIGLGVWKRAEMNIKQPNIY